MGLLDGISIKSYYDSNDLGNYQFVSLDDIVTQFQVMYVGEDKIIPKIARADIGFHAQRALAELSFDTFKSFKSQQIDLPPSLTMALPHDYVNYTKISWVDGAGIKRPIYPTKHTSNPFQVDQDDSGKYQFPVSNYELLTNGDFEGQSSIGWDYTSNFIHLAASADGDAFSIVTINSGVLTFTHKMHQISLENTAKFATKFAVSQLIDVTGISEVTISADGVSADAVSNQHDSGELYLGLSTTPGDESVGLDSNNDQSIFIENSYISWTGGDSSTQQLTGVDVSDYDEVYVVIVSNCNALSTATTTGGTAINTIDNLSVLAPNAPGAILQLNAEPGNEINSSTWDTYKSHTPSEDSIEDYRYERHWLNPNERYGLDPSHAQINGSFYIDQRLGRIHFSSNISGKTVILDYISDSLGTDGEMQVHKLAEDAMYKHMICDIMSTRANVSRGQLVYYKKDKFAAVRKAKLRLSSIKLEELTQILRGQSKQIKH